MDTSKVAPFLKRLLIGEELIALGFVITAGALGAASWYGYTTVTTLTERVAVLDARLASTTALLAGTIAEATSSLGNALAAQNQNVAAVQEQLGGFENRVGSITGAVSTLQKLTTIDKELLAKYSKVFFLSENYAPARLIDIPSPNKYNEQKPAQIIPEVSPYLSNMLNQAASQGMTLYVFSAYRSFDTQEALKGQYSVTYGAGTANQFSADQGYSEHQLGTTIDFITTGLGGKLEGFDTTPAYQWLLDNAYRYGFILSYPKNNGYYIFEPWHWRFVGVKLATDLHNQGKHFYDLDQRTIDTYLVSLFD